MQAPFCTPYIYEDALQASVQFKAMQQKQKAQKDLYLKFFNPEQSHWNVSEVSVVGHAIVTDAQNTTFPYVQIHQFFLALMLKSCIPVINFSSTFRHMFKYPSKQVSTFQY